MLFIVYHLVIIIIVSLSPATDIGLLIQARDSTETLDPSSTIWGTWIAPTEEPPRYKILRCKRNRTTSNETLFEVIILGTYITCWMTNLLCKIV